MMEKYIKTFLIQLLNKQFENEMIFDIIKSYHIR